MLSNLYKNTCRNVYSQSIFNHYKSITGINQLNYSKTNKKVSIILTEDIESIGQKGEELEVAKGYARNFFFMKNLAVHANHETRKQYEEFSKNIDYETRRIEKENSNAIKKLTKDGKITVMRKSDASGNATVPITVDNIAYSLKRRRGLVIDPKNIIMQPIENYGTHNITIVFGSKEIPVAVNYERLVHITKPVSSSLKK
ncbi:hypothetical protein DLAC_09923 [Tieghemostelium lacteum]|uniref:50S ribosomal protein L9, chloroplastic n=1 Tax=Tieghemostelium lacteum TaxID=361077 RepID=A0A151Z632_TIELA|nr:hypothetical protein DLAC_09923 [Tieghemostelium lacteum]|eukprot:KYQ89264.1 hypothetical protein DLAC_09923 [Tieghemostelium lacteum]